MRYLTIQRNKSFVACLMKMKVYVEDPTSSEIKIQGVGCKKIGELKNGEQQTFMISDENLRIFVIADKLSKNYCSDFYEVPAGTENIFISGSCKYNPLSGNAFRFDGVPTEEMKYRRKKGLKKGIIISIAAFVIGIIIGLGAVILPLFMTPEEKEFTKGELSITLNEDFAESSYAGFQAVYDSNNVAVFALQEKFADYENIEDMTLEEYTKASIEANNLNAEVKQKDGLTYFEYDANGNSSLLYHYMTFAYKSDDGFWLVQFAALKEDFTEQEENIFMYAKSVKFN